MNCDCLDRIQKRLEELHKSEIDLELKMWCDLNSGEMGAGLPPLYYHYKEGKKRKKSYVKFSFCPFCGKSGKAAKQGGGK